MKNSAFSSEAIGVRKLVRVLVEPLNRLSIWSKARHRGFQAGFGDVFADAAALPVGIAGPVSLAVEFLLVTEGETSLFVMLMHWRRPPSARFRRITAWAVVPDPAK